MNPDEDGSRTQRRRAEQVDRAGRPRMTGLSDRPASPQRAVAEAEVAVAHDTLSAIVDGSIARGDVLSVAELAGVMAAKRTAELIPLAHTAVLTELLVRATPDRAAGLVRIRAETAAVSSAGVEMEALTAAAIAALTVYDMIRDVDRSAWVGAVKLVAACEGHGPSWERAEGEAAATRRVPPGARSAGRIGPSAQRGRGSPAGRQQARRHGS